MSRAQTNKLYTNFSKGLVTEASPLAYPENVTRDELNCDIDSNADRVRRWGLNNNGTFPKITFTTQPGENTYSHVWRSVNNDSDLNFLVVCTERVLHFYKIDAGSQYTKKSFTVNLDTYRISSATVASLTSAYCSFTHGKGILFVVNKYTNPLRVEYNPTTDAITVTAIEVKVRDHYGVDDSLSVEEEPSTLSTLHHYNLLNQGWRNPEATGTGQTIRSVTLGGVFRNINFPIYSSGTIPSGPIQTYFTAIGRYPSNSKVWWVGKNAEGNFDPQLLAKTYFGNTRSARGHFIIEAFNKNRTAVSGIANLPVLASLTRPESICFTSGRVFFGHESTVYMSPVLEDPKRVGDCFQEADPTSEDISDLIPTDGGFIEIPDADKIISLKPLSNGVVVIATNGVWFINSGTQGFTAIDYSLDKISELGALGAESVVVSDTTLFWWTRTGIQAIQQAAGQFGPVPGQFDRSNITEKTIKTFYNNISEEWKSEVKGIYDPGTNSVYWLYRDIDLVTASQTKSYDRHLLIYNLTEGAFIPWKTTSRGITLFDMFISPFFVANVRQPTFLEFLTRDQVRTMIGEVEFITSFLGLSNFADREYRDGHALSTGSSTRWPYTTYESYLETGYEVLEDGLRKKQIPFLGVFFRRTEGVLEGVGGGDATLQYPSSCHMIVKWSWSGKETSNKWTTPVQVYRPRNSPFYTTNDNISNRAEYDVVYSRNKVRGSGKAIQFRFYESREGYGFTLIGWHAFFQGNTVP